MSIYIGTDKAEAARMRKVEAELQRNLKAIDQRANQRVREANKVIRSQWKAGESLLRYALLKNRTKCIYWIDILEVRHTPKETCDILRSSLEKSFDELTLRVREMLKITP